MASNCLRTHNEFLWQHFQNAESLTNFQLDQFQQYCSLLIEWNKHINLTAITSVADIITYHFQDSISLGHACDLSTIQSCADVGTGAGFPGLALAIRYPHINVSLIEVTQKKIRFLSCVTQRLGLTNVNIVPLDWLTIVRTCTLKTDIVCARASLQPIDLITMFDTTSCLRKGLLIYWASQTWQPLPELKKFMSHDFTYTVGEKTRKLIFFKTKS